MLHTCLSLHREISLTHRQPRLHARRALFDASTIRRHAKGHLFPTTGPDVEAYCQLAKLACPLQALEEGSGVGEGAAWDTGCIGGEEIEDELAALEAIFMEGEIIVEPNREQCRCVSWFSGLGAGGEVGWSIRVCDAWFYVY
jgi:hypothetical protein